MPTDLGPLVVHACLRAGEVR